MSFTEALKWRYAAKRMNNEQVSPEKLDQILEAIQLAPSSYGLQPYSVLVIKDAELRAKLREASWNQPQIVESSELIVFTVWNDITEAHIDTYIQDIATKRNVGVETLTEFKSFIWNTVKNLTPEAKQIWAAKQAYIALGFGMAAAAQLEVDTTPMEGFVASKYNEILGLDAKGLTAVVLLAVGYRAPDDWLATLPKIRRDKELLFETI